MTDLVAETLGGIARVPVSAAHADDFPAVYAREYPNIAGYCYLLVRDEELARDLAQEAFTRLLARWIHVREPRPFLFRVATNLAKDIWRERARHLATVTGLAGTPGTAPDEPDRAIRDAVDRLPRKHRDVVLLFYYGDLMLTDVAAALRRPEGTVKRLLAEARARLAVALEDSSA